MQLNHTQPAADTVAADDLPPWRFRESNRARHLRAQVFPNGEVEIVIPAGVSARTVRRFVTEHRDWILRSQRELFARRAGEPELPGHIELPAIGERLRVTWAHSEKVQVRQNGDDLLLFAPDTGAAHVRPALQAWLRRTARTHLSACVTAVSAETGLRPTAMQVRLQKTRWGSCSPAGTVSLNAAVLLRSPAEMRYVVLHELCHLQHMNHSRRFWRLVERYEPDYRRIDRRLADAWAETPIWLF